MKEFDGAQIAEVVYLPIDALRPAGSNYKDDDPATHARLVESIRRHGVLETMIVRPVGDGQYEIVNGNHRLRAYLELGVELVPCMCREMSEAEAMRVAIDVNETRFKADPARAPGYIARLSASAFGHDLAATLDLSAFDMAPPPPPPSPVPALPLDMAGAQVAFARTLSEHEPAAPAKIPPRASPAPDAGRAANGERTRPPMTIVLSFGPDEFDALKILAEAASSTPVEAARQIILDALEKIESLSKQG